MATEQRGKSQSIDETEKKLQFNDESDKEKLKKIEENDADSNLNDDETPWLKSKYKIIKNLVVIGLAWIFLFTAFQSMANLQSSLNSEEGLGTASLSAIYVSLVISCLFVPHTVIKKLGLKWTIVIAQCTYTLYIAANMIPKWYVLIPAAIVLGAGAAPLWTAQSTYLTEIAAYYAKVSGETTDAVVTRFFGIFFAMFQTSQIFGNIISSTVLKPQLENSSNNTNSSKSLICGASDCPGAAVSGEQIKKPAMSTVYLLCGIYVASAIIGIMIIIFLLNTYKRNNPKNKEADKFSCSLLMSTLKQLKNKYQLLVIPINMYVGFENAFINADYTKSFVACAIGIDRVGFTMICFGVSNAIFSYLFGFIVKFIGRIPCFICGAVIHYSLFITMLLWNPTPEQGYILYILPALWAIADSAFTTQVNSLYGALFKDAKEAAFSNYRLWESIGYAIAYAYSTYLCTSVKLYLLFVYLTIGIICYGVIEILEKLKSNESQKVEPN